jgi:hypothetical protein
MADKETIKRYRQVLEDINEEGSRIRRYTMDPFVKVPDDPKAPDPGATLRSDLDVAWKEWQDLKALWRTEAQAYTPTGLDNLETAYDALVRKVDLIQRELISDESYESGKETVRWLTITLIGLIAVYFASHGIYGGTFEPWPEWGPAKYGEVAFWSAFGALSTLLYKASHYLSRRDFDRWFKPWYVSTFLRAPILSVVIMVVLLEFAESQGDGEWMQHLMEEGNKFYVITFFSFCLGVSSDSTNSILRDLTDGVTEFISRIAQRFASWLGSLVGKES